MFIIDAAEPFLAVIEVALQSVGVAVGGALRADLNAAVGSWAAGDAIVHFQLKVMNFVLPPDPLIAVQLRAILDFTSNRTILDPPDAGCALPSVQRGAVEK